MASGIEVARRGVPVASGIEVARRGVPVAIQVAGGTGKKLSHSEQHPHYTVMRF